MMRIAATALVTAAAAQGASPMKSFKCMELLLLYINITYMHVDDE